MALKSLDFWGPPTFELRGMNPNPAGYPKREGIAVGTPARIQIEQRQTAQRASEKRAWHGRIADVGPRFFGENAFRTPARP